MVPGITESAKAICLHIASRYQLWINPTKLYRCHQLVPTFPRPDFSRQFTKLPQRGNKDEEAKLFRKWLRERDARHDLIIYSDGSRIKYPDKGIIRTGWGYTIRKGGTTQEICQGKGRLFQAKEVDAEVYGALMGLSAAIVVGRRNRLVVCLDNTSVVDGLNGGSAGVAEEPFVSFKKLAKAHAPGVTVKWVPGHKGIEGNKAADRLAKDGAMMELEGN